MSEPFSPSAQSCAVAAYLGLFVTVAVQFLQPLVGARVSAVMFGDHLGLGFVVGGGAVLLGLWLTVRT